MFVIIPLGGTGSRFKSAGYTTFPKALIPVNDKAIIFHLLDNLNLSNVDHVVIPYNREYLNYNFENLLTNRYPNVNFIFNCLPQQTRGAAETLYHTLKTLELSESESPVLSIDCDNFYLVDIINLWNGKNCVFTFRDTNPDPKYSYIIGDSAVSQIVEKRKISDNACCGAYGFNNCKTLLEHCERVINDNVTDNGEFYISRVIQSMIVEKINFHNVEILNWQYFSLGTPEQVKMYTTPFLFDLDGTLVDTDHIYAIVWNELLKDYGINVSYEFFNDFIKGTSDREFLNNFIPTLSDSEITEISHRKDTLFNSHIANDCDVLLPGVLDFFEMNKNRIIAIVTNCNKRVAEYIINKTGISQYIQLLVSANDCQNHKPHPEPYLKAIDTLGLNKNDCIIFEDSLSGYYSALNVGVKKIVLVINKHSSAEILNSRELKINNYVNLDFDKLFNESVNNECERNNNVKIIRETLNHLPVKSIIAENTVLKSGFICNINTFKIIYSNTCEEQIVLKIDNTDNELSDIAKKLELCKNERYFYDHIANMLNDGVPKCLGTFCNDNNNNEIGILLENLHKYSGQFNINLNNDIKMLLNLVNEIFKIHDKFYFEKPTDLIPAMKSLNRICDIAEYRVLINDRFDLFVKKNKMLMNEAELNIFKKLYWNFDENLEKASEYPLSFCHGDFKSPNIYYRSDGQTVFVDWQYIHLNKGISDLAFLLVESIDFDKTAVDLVLLYYHKLQSQSRNNQSFEELINDFKTSLSLFPFIVCVWFNTESVDKLIDKTFPIKFMKKLLKYYNHFL